MKSKKLTEEVLRSQALPENYSTQDALNDNEELRQALITYFDEEDVTKWPVPSKYRKIVSKEDKMRERRVAGAAKHLGAKYNPFKGISLGMRKLYWNHLDAYYDPAMSKEEKARIVWEAWCKMSEIPSPAELNTLHDILYNVNRDMSPRKWKTTIVMSAVSRVLFCDDYAELAEFLIWFTGRDVELGWMADADFYMPLRDEIMRQRPDIPEKFADGSQLEVTPENVDLDWVKPMESVQGKTMEMTPWESDFTAFDAKRDDSSSAEI